MHCGESADMTRGKRNFERDRDRMMRVQFIAILLGCSKYGMTAGELASQCGVSKRTIYRDFEALESVGMPVYNEGPRYLLVPGSTLPAIMFTAPEAMAVFMAARLLLQQSSVYNQYIATTFAKLAGVVPSPLREEMLKTLEWMRRRRADETAVMVLNIVSQCWIERRQVRIRYRSLGGETYEERTIEPYFIQPSALEHAIYIIAYCHLRADLRVFRLDRIAGATALESTYLIPEGFDANEFLNSFWSITATGKPRTVRLWFHPHVARIAAETVWHTSQTTAAQTNGAAIVTIKVALTRDLVAFVLGWSDMVKVLAPRDLQVRVAGAARRVQQMYSEAGPPTAIAPPPVWEVDHRQLKLFP
jgi:predicted DNA-binding transcriptional regulator YafY